MPGATVSDPNYELPYQYFPGPCQIILHHPCRLMLPCFLCKIDINTNLKAQNPINEAQNIVFETNTAELGPNHKTTCRVSTPSPLFWVFHDHTLEEELYKYFQKILSL